MRTARLDYYKTLQVDPTADPVVIQAAYKKLAEKYHPDRNPDPHSLTRMKALNVARDILLDPDQRARYDETRRREAASSADQQGRTKGPTAVARPPEQRPRQRRAPRKLGTL